MLVSPRPVCAAVHSCWVRERSGHTDARRRRLSRRERFSLFTGQTIQSAFRSFLCPRARVGIVVFKHLMPDPLAVCWGSALQTSDLTWCAAEYQSLQLCSFLLLLSLPRPVVSPCSSVAWKSWALVPSSPFLLLRPLGNSMTRRWERKSGLPVPLGCGQNSLIWLWWPLLPRKAGGSTPWGVLPPLPREGRSSLLLESEMELFLWASGV